MHDGGRNGAEIAAEFRKSGEDLNGAGGEDDNAQGGDAEFGNDFRDDDEEASRGAAHLEGRAGNQGHQQSADELGKRQQAIDSMVKPLKESLEKVDAKISEIEKARANAYGQLSEQLKSLGTAQLSLQAEASKLTTALRSTTTAGTWGELQLRRVVEMSGMSSYCDFTEQQTAEATGVARGTVKSRLSRALAVLAADPDLAVLREGRP